MKAWIGAVSLLVEDYDAAIAWFRDKLDFRKVADTDMGRGKRWVIMSPGGGGTNILLARADDDEQRVIVGKQTGGRVFLFLETGDFEIAHAAMLKAGVEFLESPRTESYGKVAVFRDLCGNKWDLIERR